MIIKNIRRLGALIGSGGTCAVYQQSDTTLVKLFEAEYSKTHVIREYRVMCKAARLGLGPQVYGLVCYKYREFVQYGILVQKVDVRDYTCPPHGEELSQLRRRILRLMGLYNIDVRPENVAWQGNRLICIDWSLARLIAQDTKMPTKKRAYIRSQYYHRPLNDLGSSLSLRRRDPYL